MSAPVVAREVHVSAVPAVPSAPTTPPAPTAGRVRRVRRVPSVPRAPSVPTAPTTPTAARVPRVPSVPVLVVGSVTHTRRAPVEHTFTYRHFTWLVDLDDVPRFRGPLGALARFDAADHLDGGRLGGGLRGDVERFCAARGITLAPTDRVLMLAHARALGHVFDPMSAFWCLAQDGSVRAVVVEVHNTYGGRHAYLVHPDASGRAVVPKEFYVSPFNPVEGEYRMRLVLDPAQVAVSIRLVVDGRTVLDAGLSGAVRPATRRAILATNLRHAVMTYRVTALIHVHGIRLWLRRLPVLPGPRRTQEVS